MFKGKAQLQYHTAWVVAKCDDELVNYYRWWFLRKYHVNLMRPKFGAHISIIRGEEEGIVQGSWPRNLNAEWIDFEYSNDLKIVVNYVWMPVWSPTFGDIREKCGVAREPIKGYHMTVGRVDWEILT